MTTRSATIQNQRGIHCRPSAVIAKEARGFADTALRIVTQSGKEADASQVLALISLGITCQETVTVCADGGDEEEAACNRLVDLLETHFDFPPR